MGLCMGKPMTAEEKEEAKKNRDLERRQEEDRKTEETKIKLLLLGAGESGKSTIFKQMRIVYGVGFTAEERKQKAPVVYNNTISSMKTLIEACEMLDIRVGAAAAAGAFNRVPDDAVVDEEVGGLIKTLWADPGIQEAFARRAEFQLPDCASPYLNSVDRIMQRDYMPTVDDVLCSRVRTSGIITETYLIEGHTFEMYDVGGQRNERRKWIHCFDGVTAIIFVAALSEYDQVLYEDSTENRMVEAMNLFDEICNSPLFQSTAMMLFLNKNDLFERKIAVKDIRQPSDGDRPAYFLDYEGGCDYNAGHDYLLNLFLSRNRVPNKQVYHHTTTATDTKNMQYVLNDVRNVVLENNLNGSGFMG